MLDWLMSNMGLSEMMMVNMVWYLAGVAVHVGKKMYDNKISMKEYWMEHKGHSVLSVSSLIGGYLGVYMLYPEAGSLVYFAGAYFLDSLVNKAPMNADQAMKLASMYKKN